MTLYALLSVCIGAYCNQLPAPYRLPSDLLLFSSKADCEEVLRETSGDVMTFGPPQRQVEFKSECARIFFDDYGQVERLLGGHVTCSWQTTVPDSIMGRAALLRPYLPSQHCKEPK